MTTSTPLGRLRRVLDDCGAVVVACSGGIDSLVLAHVAHADDPRTVVAHTVTPAVPSADTARVLGYGRRRGWRLEIVRSHEFGDERYLTNPVDRCYVCKSHLYDAIDELRQLDAVGAGARIVSGTNVDDLGEYRPGLIAAEEHGVRHPYVEAGIDKSGVRRLARRLGLPDAELAASPCLASRLYTGTRVTPTRLRAVELGEAVVREAGVVVVRCRMRGDDVTIEVPAEDRHRVTADVLADVAAAMGTVEPAIATVTLDPRPYGPGRAVLVGG